MTETTYIVSDLHLGSKFCMADEFMSFLNELPQDTILVLNGDIVTHQYRNLTDLDMQILERLREESFKRTVIWVDGNHDHFFNLEDKGKIQFTDKHIIDDRIAVRHGHECDWVRVLFTPLINFIYFFHHFRIRCGAKAIPTSALAKQIPPLYKAYKELFIQSAVRFAKKNNFKAVICGHVHYPEKQQRNGVLYVNTGSWLEKPLSYIEIDNGNIELKPVHEERKR